MKFIKVLMLLVTSLSLFDAQATLTKVASLPNSTPPGNIAISPEDRVFFSVHSFYGHAVKVMELKENGQTVPYPNDAWAHKPNELGQGLNDVLGLNVDRRGILWLLDGATPTNNARLVAWNTRTESLHKIIYLGFPVTNNTSFVNDLAIDYSNNAIYITDVGSAKTSALIVVDLTTGQARRVLEGGNYTTSEDLNMVIDGRVITLGDQPARIGANPITISPDNRWVYFGAMSGLSLYRIETKYLADNTLTNSELESHVVHYGSKPISDGITVDNAGNVYVTSITDNSIGVVKPDGKYSTLYQGEHLSWPDGFAVGPNNQIYFTVNELHKSPVLNKGKDESSGKFAIYRFDAIAEATVGR